MARYRHQVGQLAFLEARHRHARVEDKIRTAKQAGLGFPSREFAINAVWLQLALTAADLTAWTQTILLDTTLAKVEPNLLRYRLLRTPPPGSSAATAGPSSRSPPAGPGLTNSPPRSPGSPASDNPCGPEQPASHCPPTHKDPWRTGPRPNQPLPSTHPEHDPGPVARA